jgi:hypothetical protein
MKPLKLLFAFVVMSGATAVVAPPLVAQERPRAQNAATCATRAAPAAKASEQTPAPTPPASPAPQLPAQPGMGRNVQVDVTVSLEGGSTPITKRMTLVVSENTDGLGRSGIEVPVATSVISTGPSSVPPIPVQSFNYRSVGLNVDARPRITESGRIALRIKLEFSAVLKAAEASGSGMPSFGKSNTDLFLVLESGKPLTITQSADAEIGRGYSVEVKATLLR